MKRLQTRFPASIRCMLFVFGIFLTSVVWPLLSSAQEQPTLKATVPAIWYGELNLKIAVLRLEFHVTQGEDGKYTGKMISLDQGNIAVPLDSFAINDQTMSFAIRKVQIQFEGKLSANKKMASGTFKQLGKDYPFSLALVEPDPEMRHTQTWTGRMKAGAQKFDFQFRYFEKEGSDTKLKLDSFTENDFDRVATIAQDGTTITIAIPSTQAKIVGKLNDKSDQIDGKWLQRGGEFKIILRKIPLEQTRDPKANRPQTPNPSLSPPPKYKTTELTIENKLADLKLVGSLLVPDGKGPFPVVVLITGSGPQDRDETIFSHKPFYVIADHLAKRGVASFRFDERGVGESTGDFSTATSKDFANDVEAIVEHLKTIPKLNPQKIILMGHSEGGIIAPMIAANRDDIAGVVMLAGPGVPGFDIVMNQTRLISAAAGADATDLDYQEFFLKLVLEDKLAKDQLVQLITTKYKNKLSDEEKQMLPVAIENMKSQFKSPWFKYFLNHDPRPDLRKIKIPVLNMVGSKDLQVDPNLNMPEIKRALAEAGNKHTTSVILPNLNHLFQECETGEPSEYAKIEQTFAPAALDVISNWLTKQFGAESANQ